MNKKLVTAALIILLSVTGCSVEKKYIQTELYFGRSMSNGDIIADSAWNSFVSNEVANIFPEGFSELSIKGKWYDAERKELIAEPSQMISVVYKPRQLLSVQIDSLRNRYKNLFHQQSVLRVDKKAGISF